MKALGFVLVTISSAVCGLSIFSLKKDLLDELASFCLMLEIIQGELANKLSPMPELAQSVRKKINGKAKSFMEVLIINLNFLGERNLETIWCESLKACGAELGNAEMDALMSLGKIIGRYDVQTQCDAISNTLMLLRSSLNQKRNDLPQLGRLYLGLPMSAGAILAILLV